MDNLKNNNSGQWIALSGLVISLIIISLAVLANQAIISGYYSSDAALDFPKENIRELRLQTWENAALAKNLAYSINATSNESVLVIYESIFNNCSLQMEDLYGIHGETVAIKIMSINSFNNSTNVSDIDIVKVNIAYANGKTLYESTPEVIEL
jgi:hypothetical protein